MPQATIITDGSANNITGDGGWACILRVDNSEPIELSGWCEGTTSNRMELVAAIEGLKSLTTPHDVDLVADSAYLLNTLRNGWYEKWRDEEPHRTKPRPNMDLWEQLDGLLKFHNVKCCKVKGHSGDYWNERCDKMAGYARRMKDGKVCQKASTL